MKNYFQDKVTVITGGGGGLGRALAVEMAHSFATIHLLDIDFNRGTETKDLILQLGGMVTYHQVDVTDYNQLHKVIDNIFRKEGRIDILVNNAGMSITGEVRDLLLDHWRKPVELNLMGVVHGISIVYPLMAEQGSGQIVIVSSMAGLAPLPLIAPYVASKYALVGLSGSLRMEGEALGVKVNLVCPGRLDTSLLDSQEILQVDRKQFLKKVPFKAVPLSKAVRIILKGIMANRSSIVFPAYVRWMWWVERYMPFLLKPFYRYSLRQFRRLRKV